MFACTPPAEPSPPVLLRLDEGERESIEAFLARARAKQAELFARLGQELEALVKRLEALPLPSSREAREALISECVALGAEATPLFVRWLDVGEAALEKERFRAGALASAMQRMDTRAATGELLELLDRGPTEARVLAARVLENTSERERVRPRMVRAFKGSTGQLRATLLRSLLKLADDDPALLDEVLGSTDDELLDVALAALAETRNAAAGERVMRLLADGEKAQSHALALLAYFEALPELMGSAQIKDLLALTTTTKVPVNVRLAIVDSLPLFVSSSSNELKKALDPLVEGPDSKLAEAARIVLARLGDRVAKRELLKPYDEVVKNNPKWSQSYARRADVLRRIGDWRDAEKDYKQALDLAKNETTPQTENYIGLARCAAAQGKFKDAAMWIRMAPILLPKLKELAKDPEFAKLRASKYGDVFPQD